MTGFGRSHANCDGREVYIEVKSVNHRYLDLHCRIPKQLSFAEEAIRQWVRDAQIKRGHLEISVTYQNQRTDSKTITLDSDLVLQCAAQTEKLADALQKPGPTVSELIKLCDALSVSQADEDAETVLALMQEAFLKAMQALQAMREKEGAILQSDLQSNLQAVMRIASQVADLAPNVPLEYRQRLEARLQEWNVEIADPARIVQEVAQMADKCAIDEELSRLDSHFQQFASCLAQQGETGRRMDFLLQEMNREINTIGSKASHAGITKCVVEMKTILEKLREQVQNVE